MKTKHTPLAIILLLSLPCFAEDIPAIDEHKPMIYDEWNSEKNAYDYCAEYYPDYKIEWKNWNNDLEQYEIKLLTYQDHTTEYKDWNSEKNYYDYCFETYSDYTVECKNWNEKVEMYNWRFVTIINYSKEFENLKTMEYKDLNSESGGYDYVLCTFTDHIEEDRFWNKETNDYEYALFTFSDYTVEWKKAEGGSYYNSNIKDKSGNIIAYDHLLRLSKNGTRDIEILSDGIIYKYFGVKEIEKNKTFSFKSCIKIESGVQTKLKGGKLSYEEFYKKANDDLWLNPRP